ncbi:hypothetical protein Tco_0314762, partial [Tanacetum coccineum]
QPQCGFRLWASWMSTENSFQSKSLKAEHKCARNYNLCSLVTYKWIAHHFTKEIIEDPFMPLLNKKAMNLEDRITPSIRKTLEILKEQQRFWTVIPSGVQELEVRQGDRSFGVNLHLKKCMCT